MKVWEEHISDGGETVIVYKIAAFCFHRFQQHFFSLPHLFYAIHILMSFMRNNYGFLVRDSLLQGTPK